MKLFSHNIQNMGEERQVIKQPAPLSTDWSGARRSFGMPMSSELQQSMWEQMEEKIPRPGHQMASRRCR